MFDRHKVRRFLEECYPFNALITFCSDYFPKVHRKIGPGWEWDKIAVTLIDHCERNNKKQELLRRLKEEKRLHTLVAEIPEEDLGTLSVAIAQRMSKVNQQQREDLMAIGAIDRS